MLLTICTPTYNRSALLTKLYDSLREQTCFDFEWIVVDDGSTDGTEQLVSKWVDMPLPFSLKYVKKPNGGKHTALNVGMQEAKGDCFFIVDSDDYLTPDAVKTIFDEFAALPDGRYAGISFNRIFESGEVVGTTNKEIVECTALERKKYNINGDKAEVYFTRVIKEYPFPVFEGERFLTEAVVWNRIANDGYKLRWLNKAIYVCCYQPQGLSMSTNLTSSINGYTLFIKELFSYSSTLFLEKIRWGGVYANVASSMGFSDVEIAKNISSSLFLVKISKWAYKIKKFISPKDIAKQLKIKK